MSPGFETVAERPPQPAEGERPPHPPAHRLVEEGAPAPVTKPTPAPGGFETVAERPPQPPDHPLVEEGAPAPVTKPTAAPRGFETVAERPPQPTDGDGRRATSSTTGGSDLLNHRTPRWLRK